MPERSRLELIVSEQQAAIGIYKRMPGNGYSAETVKIVRPTETGYRSSSDTSYVVLLDLERADGETIFAGSRRSVLKDLRNKISFIPPGCPVEGWSRINKTGSFTAVYFDPTVADRSIVDLSQLSPQLQFEDNAIKATIEKIRGVVENPSADDPLYAETLSLMLMMELSRRQNSSAISPTLRRGGLTDRQVRLVTEFMEANLANDISLTDLANPVGLSRFHFVRAFKLSTGRSPYQYLLLRRATRARDMLGDPRLSVSSVAMATGFGTSARLNRAFRKIFGKTPTQIRQEMS
jgi:AraC family transcriptional regulator